MSKALAAVALAIILSACASTPPEQLSGHYYWGHEVETFRPCGSKQSFWVIGDDALLQPLRDKAAELARAKGQPYQPMYVEVSGTAERKADDGFAADYDGVYRFITARAINSPSSTGCQIKGDGGH